MSSWTYLGNGIRVSGDYKITRFKSGLRGSAVQYILSYQGRVVSRHPKLAQAMVAESPLRPPRKFEDEQ